jgi:exosortase C (VPDSG-CTERM-specific)
LTASVLSARINSCAEELEEQSKDMNAEIHAGLAPNHLSTRQIRLLAVAMGLLAVCFGSPLLNLAAFSWHNELFSYIVLVPFISGYLIWTGRKSLNFEIVRPCWPGTAIGLAAGGGIVACYWLARQQGWQPGRQDYLALMTLALLCCFWGVCFAVIGTKLAGQIFFPLAFLIFAVPIPTSWLHNIDLFFQYTSAVMAEVFFKVFGESMWRSGLELHLSDILLSVDPECSGIHSTIVLVMTSLLAGYLFLRRPWTRAVLVLAMIPVAILRNGFRIYVIGWLCIHKGPQMIDSPIHRKGGPLFFALSLIPFFLLLVFLRKRDSKMDPLPKTETAN